MYLGFIASVEVKYTSAIMPKLERRQGNALLLVSTTAYEVGENCVKEDCGKLKRYVINSTAVIKKWKRDITNKPAVKTKADIKNA